LRRGRQHGRNEHRGDRGDETDGRREHPVEERAGGGGGAQARDQRLRQRDEDERREKDRDRGEHRARRAAQHVADERGGREHRSRRHLADRDRVDELLIGKASVEDKLETLDDIYGFAVEQVAIARGQLMELTIVLILVFELVLFFAGIM
jgi:hypothetical protein